jgi:poly(beta-D-mannuronate) lyase
MKKLTPIAIALSVAISLPAFSVFAINVDKSAKNMISQSTSVSDLDALSSEGLVAGLSRPAIEISSIQPATAKAVAELKLEMSNAKDGQTIIIPSGRYENLGVVNITANNVTIKAQDAGETLLTGLVQIVTKGNNISLDSLVFTEGGPAERFGAVRLEGSNNTLQNSTFFYFNENYAYEPDERRSEYPKYLWVSLWGKDAKVINNRFEGKHKRGTLIGVQKNIDDKADNHIISDNIFYSQKKNRYNELDIEEAVRYNGNSWEAIRIGDSKSSQWPSRTQFVNNLIVDSDGERELISVKSGENRIAGNTIFESASMISLRHGKANVVEDNVIIGNLKDDTGGIRVYDENHTVQNNYITGLRGSGGKIAGNADVRGGVVINTGIIDVENNAKLDQSVKGQELNKQWTPKNIAVKNNTLVDVEFGMVHGNQSHRVSLFDNSTVENTYSGDKVAFTNNVVFNKDKALQSLRADPAIKLTNPTYDNEVYFGKTEGFDSLPNGISSEKPSYKMINGFYQFEGVGADVSRLKVLTADEVGPNYRLM